MNQPSSVRVVPGIQPQRRYSEVLEAGQTVDDSLEVASMVVTLPGPVGQAFGAGRFIVGSVTVGKPVRHDEIDDVFGREPLETSFKGQRFQDLKADLSGVGFRFESSADKTLAHNLRPR